MISFVARLRSKSASVILAGAAGVTEVSTGVGGAIASGVGARFAAMDAAGCKLSAVALRRIATASVFWYHDARSFILEPRSSRALRLANDAPDTMRRNWFGALASKLAGMSDAVLEEPRVRRDALATRKLLETVPRGASSNVAVDGRGAGAG